MEYLWVKIRSWHLTRIDEPTETGTVSTLCGREVDATERLDAVPDGEATCEVCFRVREARG